jgi:hypothetical protein
VETSANTGRSREKTQWVDRDWCERWADRLEPISHGIMWVLDRIHPKIDYVKIDKWDTWSMDHTLAQIVLPMLKQLQATKHGSPLVEDEDVPEGLICVVPKHRPKKMSGTLMTICIFVGIGS